VHFLNANPAKAMTVRCDSRCRRHYFAQGRFAIFFFAVIMAATPLPVQAEALLQLFNMSYAELSKKMPELAEAGYEAIWLPPPTKASGGLSVGYDLWDPFDLGGKDQRNTIRTRYGTEAELHHMIEVAHRLGIRVYFDNIMNHRAFDVPGYNEETPVGGEGQRELYPGMVPEDFHLRQTEDGFYRKWDNTRDWSSAWQVLNLGLADLIDIAHETPNANHGRSEGSMHPKYSFVRDLERPGQYDIDKDGQQAYFGVLLDQARTELGNSASEEQIRLKARGYILANRNAFVEDVGAYLIRAVRWKMDRTKADGLRLDAVKHVPDYFFGQQSGEGKDFSNAGYLGAVQQQFNRTRGFSDPHHRDSVFDEKRPRDDAMVFGEHLGQPPGYGGYWDAGMRLVDNDLRSKLNNVLGNPSDGLYGLDAPGAGGFAASLGVTHANSHDSDYAAQKEWQHAFYMTREGMGLIYSDGYNKAETLGESGGAFPRHANTNYLGQFGDPRIPNILQVHGDFARGLQQGLWADNDYLAFERRDNRNPDGSVRTGAADKEITMVVMMNDNTAQGVFRGINSSFQPGAYLFQYARGPFGTSMTDYYKYAWELGSVTVPPGGYLVFSYRTPEESSLWQKPISFHQNGREVPTIEVARKDGRDGDKNFNPAGLDNRGFPQGVTPPEYTYLARIPVVKAGPVSIVARTDGSAENILLKLNGGVNLNTTRLGNDPGWRDNPPGLRTDIWLGYEQPSFVSRQHPEKFAAKDTSRCTTGSEGAETYIRSPGGAVTINLGRAGANLPANNESGNTPFFIYHDPQARVGGNVGVPGVGALQLQEQGGSFKVWVKTNSIGLGFKAFLYYTVDGSFPEGAGGLGRATTQVSEIFFRHKEGSEDWWSTNDLNLPPGTLAYKLGFYKTGAPSWWPADSESVRYKKQMMTTFTVDNFNPATVQFFPHNDYARTPQLGKPYTEWPFALQTGLSEGFHVVRARAFLNRGLDAAPLYNTFTQVFYYDAQRPQGEIRFPEAEGATVGGSGYEFVIRTDMTVEEVWYHIADGDLTNDDLSTLQLNGNGRGFEPFVDMDGNRTYTQGEPFTDVNGNGVYDANLQTGWAKAVEVTPSPSITSPYKKEWRLRYNNIPASGAGTVTIRLLEASSSRNLFLDPVSAHATDLSRTVQTRGPEERINIAWPQNDGDRVDDNYTAKVYFSKSLAEGTTTESLKQRFTFSIASQQSASSEGALPLPRSEFQINYNVSDQFHELAIPLPNLYNDIADFLHTLRVVYRFPDGRERDAVRLVTANPSTKPFVRISRPTEVGSDGRPTEILLPDGPGPDSLEYVVQVETNASVETAPMLGGISGVSLPTSEVNGTTKTWSYTWTITEPGNFVIIASASLNGQETITTRNARVIRRQVVDPSGTDNGDDDNDGLINIAETNRRPLPTTNPETWSNGEVHLHFATGRSSPTSPDSDGDGLPDALEVGWRNASTPPTDTSVDTNADGYPNFIGDVDPPLYAVVENHGFVPGVGSQSAGDDRTRQAAGSMTDPLNPDSDGDGLPDGVEDANRNGWTDGDGKELPRNASREQYAQHRPNSGDWPNEVIDSFETWRETSPSKADSDDDGLNDGTGEDLNLNGRTDLFLKAEDGTLTELLLSNPANAAFRVGGATSRAINYGALFAAYSPAGSGTAQTNGWPRIVIAETDPLSPDTDGDGLPDGWEVNHGLDPLDNGVYSFRTGGVGSTDNGPAGDPDGDGLDNATELNNGTHPNQRDEGGDGGTGEGSISIGRFTDWTHEDLLVLDEYNEGGSQGADVYRTNSFDSSRDIVAFSFRDGGDTSAGGDGRIYFRIDFMDLAPNAWQGEVDAYVVIDTGNTGVGERSLPNSVDLATDMRWEVVVGVYGQNFGSIFVDRERNRNTTDQYQNPLEFGVQVRSFGGANEAAWSSRYDALEVAVGRQNLLDAGWNGNPEVLNFQVFTTVPNTQSGGAGDLPGRNDIRDTIYDDWLASDFWRDQDNIRLYGKLTGFFGRSSANDRNRNAKVVLLAHGNQAIQPAQVTQDLVRRGDPPAGYSRLVQTHDLYSAPLTLHVTPTLASSLQWARNPQAGSWPNNDGPSFNFRVGDLIAQDKISLTGSTFADHVPRYFQSDFNRENKAVAEEFLDSIYGGGGPVTSRDIFWSSERILDGDTLDIIRDMGYTYTFADQMRHFVKWFGRADALGTAGYRINEVNGIKILPIHDVTSEYLNLTWDEGSALPLRQLLSRRSRSATQDQVVVLWRDFNDFLTSSTADNYDANVRWLSSRPWVRLVTAGDIVEGRADYRGADGNTYTTWGTVNQGEGRSLRLSAKDWVDWATNEDYDNWYNKLRAEKFTANLPFGQVGVGGHAESAWASVRSTSAPNLQKVARAVLGGTMFQTAFFLPDSDQATNLSKFSTGDYIYPASLGNQTMADFARNSQGQTRFASVYARVQSWADTAESTTHDAQQEDVDLDGEPEFLLYNSKIFAVFERQGGRMTAAWMRDAGTGKVWQVAGNFASYSNSDGESEGSTNETAFRTSGFKDWSAVTGSLSSGEGVNALYTVTPHTAGKGWTFSHAGVSKSVSLPNAAQGQLRSVYTLTGPEKLYVRFGLSPNLLDLMLRGHEGLTSEVSEGGRVSVANASGGEVVRAWVAADSINLAAIDTQSNSVMLRRNQAQTHQVEVELDGLGPHEIVLGFDNGSDLPLETDGIPDAWWDAYGVAAPDRRAEDDLDGDGLTNRQEYILDSNPADASSGRPKTVLQELPGGFRIVFPTRPGRMYQVRSTEDLQSGLWQDLGDAVNGTGSDAWVDDAQALLHVRRFYRVDVSLP
jgi:glycosidase